MAKVTDIKVMQQNAVTQGTRSGFMFQHIPCVDQQLLTGADKHVGLDLQVLELFAGQLRQQRMLERYFLGIQNEGSF